MRPGRYVEVVGVLSSASPAPGPVSGDPLVGWDLLCTVFVEDDVIRLDAHRWGAVILRDASGEVPVVLDGSTKKVPAHAEATYDDPGEIAALARRAGITFPEGAREVQALERGVPSGKPAAVQGYVGPIDADAGDRVSVGRALRGDPRRPLVILPR